MVWIEVKPMAALLKDDSPSSVYDCNQIQGLARALNIPVLGDEQYWTVSFLGFVRWDKPETGAWDLVAIERFRSEPGSFTACGSQHLQTERQSPRDVAFSCFGCIPEPLHMG